MRQDSRTAYGYYFDRVFEAQWLVDHVAPEHQIELCQRMPICDLIAWTRALKIPATFEQIGERLGVARATAFRYRSALAAAGERVTVPLPARAVPQKRKAKASQSPAASFLSMRGLSPLRGASLR